MSLVVIAAADATFEQRVRAVLARPDGNGVLLWDKPLNAATDVQALADRGPAAVILGPKLGKDAAFSLAAHFDRHYPAISVLVVAVPCPDTWQRALTTGTRAVISPVASDEELPRTVDEEEATAGAPDLAPTGNLLVTLALRPADAERLVFTAEHGSIWLAVEGSEVSDSPTPGQTRVSIYEAR